ncbi:hypothetical protein, partial [Mycobacterium tuberculosis]|uniref:hypothetical protein n=1 Tax=Mycobacterium tuberculosis TaxID=1773 RepID=UPI0039BD62FA
MTAANACCCAVCSGLVLARGVGAVQTQQQPTDAADAGAARGIAHSATAAVAAVADQPGPAA